jgi:hypothetical protein
LESLSLPKTRAKNRVSHFPVHAAAAAGDLIERRASRPTAASISFLREDGRIFQSDFFLLTFSLAFLYSACTKQLSTRTYCITNRDPERAWQRWFLLGCPLKGLKKNDCSGNAIRFDRQ